MICEELLLKTSVFSFLRSPRRFGFADIFYFSLMVGLGETFFSAFALALGFDPIHCGLVASLPLFGGSILQLLAPYLLKRMGSCRRWVVLCAFLQGSCFLPLMVLAFWRPAGAEIIFFMILSLYWAFGLGLSPAWSVWMSCEVGEDSRARYLAIRNRVGQFGLLFGMGLAGIFLDDQVSAQQTLRVAQDVVSTSIAQASPGLLGFVAVFVVAMLARWTSAFLLSRQVEQVPLGKLQKRIPFTDLVRRFAFQFDGRMLLVLIFFQMAVNLSSPFFTPFLFKQVGVSYGDYLWLLAAGFMSKIVVFPLAGRFADKWGPYRLLRTGALGAVLLPALWSFNSSFQFLLFSQILSGVMWALYDLGAAMTFFHSFKDEERTSFMSFYNLASSVAVITGSFVGAKFLKTWSSSDMAYQHLFLLSSLARLLAFGVISVVLNRAQKERTSIWHLLPSSWIFSSEVLRSAEFEWRAFSGTVLPLLRSQVSRSSQGLRYISKNAKTTLGLTSSLAPKIDRREEPADDKDNQQAS